jgi:hypothetical protein
LSTDSILLISSAVNLALILARDGALRHLVWDNEERERVREGGREGRGREYSHLKLHLACEPLDKERELEKKAREIKTMAGKLAAMNTALAACEQELAAVRGEVALKDAALEKALICLEEAEAEEGRGSVRPSRASGRVGGHGAVDGSGGRGGGGGGGSVSAWMRAGDCGAVEDGGGLHGFGRGMAVGGRAGRGGGRDDGLVVFQEGVAPILLGVSTAVVVAVVVGWTRR